MGVGKSGKIGFLELELQNDSDKQKTIITKNNTSSTICAKSIAL